MGNQNAVTRTWEQERHISMHEAYYLGAMHGHMKKLATSEREKAQRGKYEETFDKVGNILNHLDEDKDPEAKAKLKNFQNYIWDLSKCDYKVTVGMHPPETDCVDYAMVGKSIVKALI